MRRLFPIILILVSACSEQPAAISFAATFDGQSVDCSSAFPALNDLRFHVSELSVSGTDGDKFVGITAIDGFQSREVALIDLEDGQGSCDGGTPETNRELRVALPRGDFDTLRMTIGVPFELNHENPLLAEPPLDDPAMHWHWRSGYKFMRAGMAFDDGVSWLHLGSTGCEGATGNIQGCNRPNRVRVSVPLQAALANGVEVRLEELFDVDNDTFDCSSGPMEASCERIWPALGLAGDGALQSVFTVGSD